MFRVLFLVAALAAVRASAAEVALAVREDELVETTIDIPNELGVDAILVEVVSGCGCITPRVDPVPVKAGAAVAIHATIDARLRHRDFTTSVQPVFLIDGTRTKGPDIAIHANVKTAMTFAPPVPMVVRTPMGKMTRLAVEVTAEQPVTSLAVVQASRPGVASVRRSDDGRWFLDLTFEGTELGVEPFSATLASNVGRRVVSTAHTTQHPYVDCSQIVTGILTVDEPSERRIRLTEAAPPDASLTVDSFTSANARLVSFATTPDGAAVVLQSRKSGHVSGVCKITVHRGDEATMVTIPVNLLCLAK
ncbi:MAG: DUF1573 domain-containing protein [Planctomycetes bacterium]|nr:DUF1573 domain-containing protein [Planctomycetota bacterium]